MNAGEQSETTRPSAIVFFDGVCALCNRWVDRLIRRDPRGILAFAPLQGETARRLCPDIPGGDSDSLVVLEGGKRQMRSEGVLCILYLLGGRWRFLSRLLRLVPRGLRDLVYDLVARNRYRWFGRRASCRRPESGLERERFLP